MGGMFAGSHDLKSYWHTILNGVDRICDPPASHRQLNDYFDCDPKKPDHIYCNRGGFLPTIAFDPTEFGIPPTALEATDTSQLLGLMGAKMALADAGYGDGRDFDREHTSVIIGVTGTQELVISLGSRLGHPLWRRAMVDNGLDDEQVNAIVKDIGAGYVPWQENSFPGLLGNVVAGRICSRLNLGGTNCVVDAACASSLSALHLSLMELASGKSNMVITGGVDTINDIFMHMCFSKTGVLSHSGDAKPFSANADGTVLGEGIGLMVLKRLDDAKRDNDRVYAVIRAIGSSSDGKSQSIYAPRVEGQARALVDAYRQADITPDTVSLIEAHGTGTRVGDEVEFTALKRVFGEYCNAATPCALGSVKSMIGHTKAAAGAAGLIKASLALHHKVLPPTIKADPPDPKLDIEASPFYLNTIARPWLNESETPRRCGVSSFGFGGSNFHVVLEEYQATKSDVAWDGSVEILAFSGPTASAVTDAVQRMLDSLDDSPEPLSFNRIARDLRAEFKSTHAFRLVLVLQTTTSKDILKKQLKEAVACVGSGKSATLPAQGIYFATPAQSMGKVAFMFPGQGSQYVYMGRDLVCMFPDAMAACEAANRTVEGRPTLWQRLFPQPAGSNDQQQRQTEALRQTDVAQPAIGTISLAMLAALEYFGLRPDATCGHSYGELPALYAAGWIDRDTLLQLSATRGSLMAQAGKDTDAGTMLAVKAGTDALSELLADYPRVVLANINSPDQRVLSGPSDAIEAVKAACDQKGLRSAVLPVAAAFHSPLVESAATPFAKAVAASRFTPSSIPVYANFTAAPYPTEPQAIVDVLSHQMISPVQFQQMIQHLYDSGVRTFIEVGPKSVLCGLVRSILSDTDMVTIALDRSSGKTAGILDLAHAIGQLAALGADVNLTRWEQKSPHERTPKMVVPLCGANYRAPRAPKPKPEPTKIEKEKTIAPTTVQSSASPSATMVPRPQTMETPKPMQSITPTSSQVPVTGQQMNSAPPTTDMNTALSVVQKGLESIQALQQQTAQAHQKFLETQSQASRTLQEMMKSTQVLVGSLTGMPAPRMAVPSATPQPVAPLQTPPPPVQKPAPMPDTAASPPPVAPAPPEPVAPVAPSIEPAAPAPSQSTAASASVSAALLEIVSELTGYPVEMLGLEMDIEADLGIDSIKRVEILSAMEEKMPHLPQVTPDMVGTLKTLGQICDFLAGSNQPAPSPVTEDKPTPTDATPQPVSTTIPRQIVDVRSIPKAPGRTLHIENGRKILVIDDGSAYAPAMVKQLQAKGIDAQSIAMDIVDQTQAFKGIAGLILCPMTPPESAFLAAKHAAGELTQTSKTGDALFACLTCLDGAFGFAGNSIENPIQGALPGLVKTAALEWQDVVCRAIDLAPSFADTDVAAKQVVDELLTVAPHDPVEIGLGPDDRTILCPVPAEVAEGPLHLGPKDVIVITGGARGVTAACALALARQANGASLALIGRSALPEPIPDWLQAVNGEGAMKKRIIKHAFGGNPPTPKELESEYRRQIANMEINRTLDALQKAGVNAAYFSADVTDAKSIASSLSTIRSQMGPITGLIHGAGVLHDRLIADKSIHQFRQVYATKVDGLINVLNALESDPLGYLVLFSSVSARTGNTGQCDYAMANEVLNKLAHIESMRRPDCRVTAINWGPWDGGMVTPSLKNAFAKMDISLIPLEMGAATLVAEMANADPSPIEVLVGSMLTDEDANAGPSSEASMALLERRELDLHRYPVLESHVIGGRPVVPFALISEWIGHGALKRNPGYALHGLDDFRLLSGIRVDQSGKLVRLMAGKPKKAGDVWQVDVELRNGVKNGKDVIHSRAKALLVDRFPDAPPFTGNGKNGSRPYPRQVSAIYGDILFHGDRLRAIEAINEYSDHGMTAKLVAAPKPEVWMQDPIQEHWMADPMVLDGAFQMAIVWCFEQTGKVCLPSYTRTYRQYRSAFPSGGAKAVMTVTSQSQRKMVADFTFLDHDDQVVATLSGYEAIIDDSLMHAFKNNGLPSLFKGDRP